MKKTVRNNIPLIQKIFSRHSLEKPQKITKFTSGQINDVYNIDDRCVLKMTGGLEFAQESFQPQPKLMNQLAEMGVKVPLIIAQGELEGKEYLIMERIEGANLIYDWPKFSPNQKENMVVQIVEQLRLIHSVNFSQYSIPIYKKELFSDLGSAIRNNLNFLLINRNKFPKRYWELVEYLEAFWENNKHLLNETGTAVLVHNDMHWENVMYKNDRVTGIIDWDWASAAPRDYELWRIVVFCHNPRDYAEEKLEAAYARCPMRDVVGYFQKHYPDNLSLYINSFRSLYSIF